MKLSISLYINLSQTFDRCGRYRGSNVAFLDLLFPTNDTHNCPKDNSLSSEQG